MGIDVGICWEYRNRNGFPRAQLATSSGYPFLLRTSGMANKTATPTSTHTLNHTPKYKEAAT